MRLRDICYAVCTTALLFGCQTNSSYFKSAFLSKPEGHAATNHTTLDTQFSSTATSVDQAIVSELIMLDKREIAIALQAKEKATKASTQKFANYLLKKHTQHLKKTLILSQKLNISPKDKYRALRINQERDNEQQILEKADHADFDTIFIRTTVHNHRCALSFINDNLRIVTNPVLKAHLMATYQLEEQHLHQAEK